MRRLLPLVALVALFAEDARASCAPPNPRGQLQYADAAFDGRFLSSRSDGDVTWLKFAVDRVLKGQLAETVEIHQRGVSTIHFGDLRPGERLGLTMNFKDGVWLSNDCQRSDPEELADAVDPLPRPPGRGRAAYLVSGWFGDAVAALLDRRGRTLAYVFGGGGGQDVSVCPGGRRFVQLSGRIRVRRTRDLRVLDSRDAGSTRRVHCLGRVVVRATSTGLFRGDRRIWRGTWRGIAFHRRHAYVTLEEGVTRVDLVTGDERSIAGARAEGAVSVSPDARRLALLSGSRLVVLDLRTGRSRSADAAGYNAVVWAAGDRLALLGYRHFRSREAPVAARFFDASLRPLEGIPDWAAWPAVGAGGAVVGIVGHRVERGTPGGASELGRLPGSSVWDVQRLPGVAIRAPRRVPRY